MHFLNFRLTIGTILVLLIVGCSKKQQDFQSNQYKPQNNDIASNVSPSLSVSNASIIQIVDLDEEAFIFVAKENNQFSINRFSKRFNIVEKFIKLNYVPQTVYSGRDKLLVCENVTNENRSVIHIFDVHSLLEVGIDPMAHVSNVKAIMHAGLTGSLYCVGKKSDSTNAIWRYSTLQESNNGWRFNQVDQLAWQGGNSSGEELMATTMFDSLGYLLQTQSNAIKTYRVNSLENSISIADLGQNMFVDDRTKIAFASNGITQSIITSGLYLNDVPNIRTITTSNGGIHFDSPNTASLFKGIKVQVQDVKVFNDTVYACGLSHYNILDFDSNVVGNAMILKIYRQGIELYTFGSEDYLSVFNSLIIANGNIYAAGSTKQYFDVWQPIFWRTDLSVSQPYLMKIPLDKLRQ